MIIVKISNKKSESEDGVISGKRLIKNPNKLNL